MAPLIAKKSVPAPGPWPLVPGGAIQPVQPTLQVPPGGLQVVGVDGEELDLVFVDDNGEAAEEAAKVKEREEKRKRQSSKDSKT